LGDLNTKTEVSKALFEERTSVCREPYRSLETIRVFRGTFEEMTKAFRDMLEEMTRVSKVTTEEMIKVFKITPEETTKVSKEIEIHRSGIKVFRGTLLLPSETKAFKGKATKP
jgi:hypothetical protein